MSQNEMPITQGGLDKIHKELDYLIKVEREDLKIVIAEARALGDLKENAEYHSAKEKQSHIEGRIGLLQGIVANAKVINIAEITSSNIVFGATVTLYDADKDINLTYQILGNAEADINSGKVSYLSPLGKALMGKEEGDDVIVKAPKGDIEYEIQSVEYIA